MILLEDNGSSHNSRQESISDNGLVSINSFSPGKRVSFKHFSSQIQTGIITGIDEGIHTIEYSDTSGTKHIVDKGTQDLTLEFCENESDVEPTISEDRIRESFLDRHEYLNEALAVFTQGVDDGGGRTKNIANTTLVTDVVKGLSSKDRECAGQIIDRLALSIPDYDHGYHVTLLTRSSCPRFTASFLRL